MVWPRPHVGRRTVAMWLSSFVLKDTAKYIFSRWMVLWRDCSSPCQEPITGDPIGREMENGSISILTEVADPFNCGRYHSREDFLSRSPKMAACLAPNLRTGDFSITRSLACRGYGRCHCEAGKKPASWINRTGSSPSRPAEHSLPGGTGRWLGTEFTSSISSPITTPL